MKTLLGNEVIDLIVIVIEMWVIIYIVSWFMIFLGRGVAK